MMNSQDNEIVKTYILFVFWILGFLYSIWGFINIEKFVGHKWQFSDSFIDYLYPMALCLIALYNIFKLYKKIYK